MTEFVLAVAVFALLYHVAGWAWFFGFAIAFLLACVIDGVTE